MCAWKRISLAVGSFLLIGGVALVVAYRIHLPPWLLPIVVFCGAPLRQGPRARRTRPSVPINTCLLDALEAAREAERLSIKEAAHLQGISETQLVRQNRLRDGAHPSLARAGNYPKRVLARFVVNMAKQLDLFVIEELRIADLIQRCDGLVTRLDGSPAGSGSPTSGPLTPAHLQLIGSGR